MNEIYRQTGLDGTRLVVRLDERANVFTFRIERADVPDNRDYMEVRMKAHKVKTLRAMLGKIPL
jgi:hypothetical protein